MGQRYSIVLRWLDRRLETFVGKDRWRCSLQEPLAIMALEITVINDRLSSAQGAQKLK